MYLHMGRQPQVARVQQKCCTVWTSAPSYLILESWARLRTLRHCSRREKQVAADYADKRRQASERELETGDLVLLEKKRENELPQAYEREPYKITACYGDQIHMGTL